MIRDRAEPLVSFISNIGSYPAATMHFIHAMLPHRPLQYLPSGRIYTKEKFVKGLDLVKGLSRDSTSNAWQGQQVLADRMHQRLLLQIGFADKLLGQLISEMKSSSIYECVYLNAFESIPDANQNSASGSITIIMSDRIPDSMTGPQTRFTWESIRLKWQHNCNVGFHLKIAARLSKGWGPLLMP